jgi:hypothetical protein
MIPENQAAAPPPPGAGPGGGTAVKAPRRRGSWRASLAFVVYWLIPAAWVGMTPPITPPHKPATRTRQALTYDNRAMHLYIGRYRTTPPDFNALRTFAHSEKLKFDAYDGYGERFDYLRLDDSHYLLRSFGEDQMQNTVTSAPDLGVVHWGPRPGRSVTYKYAEPGAVDLYPAALLAGVDSPDHQWLARLFIDPANQTRRLLVRHRQRAGLFMVANHDAVEEFLWMPDGKRIVFTASAGVKHRDGVFLWNLADDVQVNLLDQATKALPMSPAHGGSNLWLALAGVTRSGIVYVYQHLRHDGALDPAEFFSAKQLLAFETSDKPGVPPKLIPVPSDAAAAAPLTRQLDPSAHVEGVGGLKSQEAWQRLPLSGDLESVLVAWHQFSERMATSPLYPYSLWMLSTLYAEASATLAKKAPHDADVLRTFGTEIATALLNYPLAPSYLRGLALFAHENLMEGLPLPYRLSRLTPAGEPLHLTGPSGVPAAPGSSPPPSQSTN